MKIKKEKLKKIILWATIGLSVFLGIYFFHFWSFICAVIITVMLFSVSKFGEENCSGVEIYIDNLTSLIIVYGLVLWPLLEITESLFWLGSISSILICIFRYQITEYFYPPEDRNKTTFMDNIKSEANWLVFSSICIFITCGGLSFFSCLESYVDELNKDFSKKRKIEKIEEQVVVENNNKTAIVKMVKSEIIDGNTIYYIVAEDKHNSLKKDTLQIKSGNGAIWIEENSVISYTYSPTEGFCNFSVIGKEEK